MAADPREALVAAERAAAEGGPVMTRQPDRRPRRSAGVASTIGGILVGFDEQVWNRRPPAQEQVASVDRALRVAVPGGRVIALPEVGDPGDDQAAGDGPVASEAARPQPSEPPA